TWRRTPPRPLCVCRRRRPSGSISSWAPEPPLFPPMARCGRHPSSWCPASGTAADICPESPRTQTKDLQWHVVVLFGLTNPFHAQAPCHAHGAFVGGAGDVADLADALPEGPGEDGLARLGGIPPTPHVRAECPGQFEVFLKRWQQLE